MITMNFAHLFERDDNTRSLDAGEVLIEVGDSVEEMYVVLEGEAEVAVGEKVVEVVKRGGLIGEMSMVDRFPASATVRAASALKLAVVDDRRFLFLIQQHPTFALEVMKVMAFRLRKMDAREEVSEL